MQRAEHEQWPQGWLAGMSDIGKRSIQPRGDRIVQLSQRRARGRFEVSAR